MTFDELLAQVRERYPLQPGEDKTQWAYRTNNSAQVLYHRLNPPRTQYQPELQTSPPPPLSPNQHERPKVLARVKERMKP